LSPSPPSGQTEKNRSTGLFGRLRDKLAATQRSFTRGLSDLLLGNRALDDALFEELETLLLSADVGVETTQHLVSSITDQVSRKQLKDARAVYGALRQGMLSILEPCDRRLVITPERPYVLMVVGVNGVGKTTTIAKLANHLKNKGLTLTLAAGDTLSGTVNITIEAFDDDGVLAVRIFVDEVLLTEDPSAPYQGLWNTGSGADPITRTLRAEARDFSGNLGTAQVTVVVKDRAPL